jgi:N-acetylmuramoyl-L-alanine amidase
MRKFMFFMIVFAVLLLSTQSLFAGEFVVCIDPGHGGPGADKYHNGGDGWGCAGLCLGIAEQWVNFQVAWFLRDSIEAWCVDHDVIMTRESEDDPNLTDDWNRNQWYRANVANYAKGPDIELHHAEELISIHHNGLGANNQGTEVFWCSRTTTDSGYSRCGGAYPACQDSMLAWKIQLSLIQAWGPDEGYEDRCDKPGCWYCCDALSKYAVLKRTVMVSALSEASNLNECSEETLFNDPSMLHIREEARAIFNGWDSYISRGGVNCISYAGQANPPGRMIIDGDTIITPYYVCWSPGEVHTLQAQDTLDWGPGFQYKFSHWIQDLLGEGVDPELCWLNAHFDTIWTITVPQGENSYYAFMKGGPYKDSVYSPNGGEVWTTGEERAIMWWAFVGADTTTLIDLFLSTDGGSMWDIVATDLPNGVWQPGDEWTGDYSWTVMATPSTQCRIKVRAHDCAGNDTFDISNGNFTIICAPKPNAPSNLTASNAGCDARITLNWRDNSNNETGFNIYRDGQLTGSVGANVTTFTQTHLPTWQSYSYYVKAHNQGCESGPSNTVNQTPGRLTPAAPTNLQVVNVGECQFLATWEDNSDNEDGFQLYNGEYWHATLPPNTESFQGYWYPETEWGQQSDLYVYACDGLPCHAGCKAYSNHVVMDPPGGVIPAPSNCQLHGPPCDLTATWQNNDNYDFCQVRHYYTGCDIPPWPCMDHWYRFDFFASCGGTSIPHPHGCGCLSVSVRGGKGVNCGSLGNRKWSGYSNGAGLSQVICNEPSHGCPYLFVREGEKFMAENTILASVEMAEDRGLDVNDYYLVKQLMTRIDKMYKLQISEFEQEHSFFDQVELLAVDHEFGSKVAVTREGEIFVYDPAKFREPISCYDEQGVAQDSFLQLDPEDRAFMNGPGSLILDFGPVSQDSTTQILLLPCCGPGDGYSKIVSKVVAGEYIPQIGLLVETEKEGVWHVVDSIPPRLALQEVFVDVSDYRDTNGELKLKLSWDERGYSFSEFRCFEAKQFDQPKSLTLINASHSSLGNVSQKLAFDDNDYVELLPGEDIDLDFSYLPSEPGKTRDFVFECNGYYITDNLAKAATPPSSEELQQNYPNPFNPQTQIEFSQAEASKVSLVIYNLLGQKVVTLVDEMLPEGKHKIHWNGMDESGDRVASGIYFYRLQAGEYNEVRKMIMIK